MQGRQTNSNIYYIKGLAQEALKSGITIDEVNEVFNRKNEAIKNMEIITKSYYTDDKKLEENIWIKNMQKHIQK